MWRFAARLLLLAAVGYAYLLYVCLSGERPPRASPGVCPERRIKVRKRQRCSRRASRSEISIPAAVLDGFAASAPRASQRQLAGASLVTEPSRWAAAGRQEQALCQWRPLRATRRSASSSMR